MKLDELAYQVDWKPLEAMSKLHPNEIDCGDFMYMGTLLTICLYKHRITRRYLNIDTDGTCWLYHEDGYFQIAEESAIERVNA